MAAGSSEIRSLTLVGHGDAGKTTLAEALLAAAGASKRVGRVADGSTTFDFDADEQERRHSIDASVAWLDWKGSRIHLVDTPGYPDFVGAALASLAAVETAVICVNASRGIAVNTRHMWDAAGAAHKARVLVVTRIDMENLDLPRLVEELRETFGDSVLPVNLPVGRGPEVSEVVSVLHLPVAARHDNVVGDEAEASKMLVERIVEADDELLNRYLEGQTPTPEELRRALSVSVRSGKVVPLLFVAAEKGIGVTELLDFAVAELPASDGHLLHPLRDVEKGEPVDRDAGEPFAAVVWKNAIDPFVGKLTYLRILSGNFDTGMEVLNPRVGRNEKLVHAYFHRGKDETPAAKATAGDILVVSKLETAALGDTLCDPRSPVRYAPMEWPTPMVSLALETRAAADEQKLGPALGKLAEEDPTFRVETNRETHERVASGLSALHLQVALSRLKRRFHLEVNTRTPKIPYRETVQGRGDGHHRHKKQTGGRGQLAEGYLGVTARGRGEGFEFLDGVVGGTVPRQFIPAVEKGVRQALETGVLAGYPVVDVAAELYDGKDHAVDSSEAAFKIAANRAFRDGFMKARPALLEPVMRVEIVVPVRFMGDITGDLNKRRGRIQGMDTRGPLQAIEAMVPLAEIANYSTELRSITAGEGSYSMAHDHYDAVPSHIAEQIIARAKKPLEEDEG